MGRAPLCEDLWLDSMRVIGHGPKMAWAVDEDMIDDLTASVRTIVHRYGKAIIHYLFQNSARVLPNQPSRLSDHYIHPLPASGLSTP